MLQPDTQPMSSKRYLQLYRPNSATNTDIAQIDGLKSTLPIIGISIDRTFGAPVDQPSPIRAIRELGVITPVSEIAERLSNPHAMQESLDAYSRLMKENKKLGREHHPFALLIARTLTAETVPTNESLYSEEDLTYIRIVQGLKKIDRQHERSTVYATSYSTPGERNLFANNMCLLLNEIEQSF